MLFAKSYIEKLQFRAVKNMKSIKISFQEISIKLSNKFKAEKNHK